MYANLVIKTIRSSWQDLNRQDPSGLLQQLAPGFSYVFYGDHALSGTRRTKAALEQFFTRLFKVFPGAEFAVEDVLVKGGPWNTTAMATISIRATLHNGRVYKNNIVQTIRIRWGRITEIRTLEDTQTLVAALQEQVSAGVAEAGAAPIHD
jgi:ketosteroid isomerase-like protein